VSRLATSGVHAVNTIGMDMGKNTLHKIGLDSSGTFLLREKVSRGRITSRLTNLLPCLIGINWIAGARETQQRVPYLREDSIRAKSAGRS
jgi:hypothetical protein